MHLTSQQSQRRVGRAVRFVDARTGGGLLQDDGRLLAGESAQGEAIEQQKTAEA